MRSCIILLTMCASLSAQDWQLSMPSVTPLRYGYATGTYSSPHITENGITKKWVNVNLRHKYLEPQEGTNQTWGSLTGQGKVLNDIANILGYNGAVTYTKSSLESNWTYIPNGESKESPSIKLEWSIENKVSSPAGEPVISSRGHGAVSGSISQTVKRIDAIQGQKYYLLLRAHLNADLTRKQGAEAFPTVAGYMSFKAGPCYIIAKYEPNLDGQGPGWVVTRHTGKLDGTFYDKVYKYHGYKLDPSIWMGCYVETTGSKAITYTIQTGKQSYPQDKTGTWEDITSARDNTAMVSVSYPENTTGTDPIRDDKWAGSIEVKPAGSISHP